MMKFDGFGDMFEYANEQNGLHAKLEEGIRNKDIEVVKESVEGLKESVKARFESLLSTISEKEAKDFRLAPKDPIYLDELALAAEYYDEKIFKYLVENFTTICVAGALGLACIHGKTELAKKLIEIGHGDVNACDKNGAPGLPLCQACIYGYTEIVKSLVDAGACVTVNRNFPIYAANLEGHEDIVKILSDAGAVLPSS